jgi:hypothetical protein
MAEACKDCGCDLIVKERTQTNVCTARWSPLGCEGDDVVEERVREEKAEKQEEEPALNGTD